MAPPSLSNFGVKPLGYATAGALGAALGPRGILLFGAACITGSGILGCSSNAMREAA